MTELGTIWVYLSASPLLWFAVTILAYLGAARLASLAHGSPLANTVLISAAAIIALLVITGTPYDRYFAGAQFVHVLLGPATVSLAIPLYRNRRRVRSALVPMMLALFAGSLTAIGSAVAIAMAFGAPAEVIASIVPKSTSAPIAMGLAESLNGIPSLAAVLVIATGICGAIMVTPLMNALRIRNFAARGFAVGVASHGIGTARAFQVSDVAGAFAGIAMALNGALTSVLVLVWLGMWSG
jgi:predicted murein hydrolase (TIGR00659 family)